MRGLQSAKNAIHENRMRDKWKRSKKHSVLNSHDSDSDTEDRSKFKKKKARFDPLAGHDDERQKQMDEIRKYGNFK